MCLEVTKEQATVAHEQRVVVPAVSAHGIEHLGPPGLAMLFVFF